VNGEFEFVKLDPKIVMGFEKTVDKNHNCLDFIIYLKEDMTPIGNVLLDRYDSTLKSLETSVCIHPNYWKKGYMTEALLKIMNYVYTNLDINNIIYGYALENFKSKGLKDKIDLIIVKNI